MHIRVRPWLAAAAAATAAVAAVTTGAVGVAPSKASATTGEELTFVRATNAVRAFWHEARLVNDPILEVKAELWAQTMAQHETLSGSNLAAGLGKLGSSWARTSVSSRCPTPPPINRSRMRSSGHHPTS
jgi:hypothetical protein